MTNENFGLFGTGFSIILFFGAIADGIILTQMVLIYPKVEEDEKNKFIQNTFFITLFFSAVVFFLSAITIFIKTYLVDDIIFPNRYLFWISLSSISFVIKEFVIRLSYNLRKENIAVLVHSVIMIITIIIYLYFYFTGFIFSVYSAFQVFTLSHFFGFTIGLFLLKIKPFFSYPDKSLYLVYNQFWKNGKWACLNNIVYIMRLYAYIYITLLLFDPGVVGDLNAARMFITPSLIIIPAVVQLSMPRLSVIRQNNIFDLFYKGKLITSFFLFVTISYSMLLLMGFKSISFLLSNYNYNDLFPLVILWCIYAISLGLRNGILIIIQVLQEFKKLSKIYAITCVLTIIFSYLLGISWSVYGVIMGLIIGELANIFMLSKLLKQIKIKL